MQGALLQCATAKRLKIVSCYVFIGFYANINIDILHFFTTTYFAKSHSFQNIELPLLGTYIWIAMNEPLISYVSMFFLNYDMHALLRVSLRGMVLMQANHHSCSNKVTRIFNEGR